MKMRVAIAVTRTQRVDLRASLAFIDHLSQRGVVVHTLQPCRDYPGYELLIQRGSRTPALAPLDGPALRLIVSRGVFALAGTESDTGEFWFLGEALRDTREPQDGPVDVASWQLWQLVERGHPGVAMNRWRRSSTHAFCGSESHLVRLRPRCRFAPLPVGAAEYPAVSALSGVAGLSRMDLIHDDGGTYVRRDDLIAYLASSDIVLGEDDDAATIRFMLRAIADYLQLWDGAPVAAHAFVGLSSRRLTTPKGQYVHVDDLGAWIERCTGQPVSAALTDFLTRFAAGLGGLRNLPARP